MTSANVPVRTPSRLVLAALACLLATSGCFSTVYGQMLRPSGWEEAPRPAGVDCPDLAGTFENLSRKTTRVDSFDQTGRDAKTPGRHLAALFGALEQPEAVAQVTVSTPAPRMVRFELSGSGDRAVEVTERRDFTCAGAGATFDASPAMRRREGGSIRLSRDTHGCLLVRAMQRDGWGFFLVVPILEHVSAEWNQYCPPGTPFVRVSPVPEAHP